MMDETELDDCVGRWKTNTLVEFFEGPGVEL